MKVIAIMLLSCLGAQAMAETSNVKPGQVYIGKETYNEHSTGKVCYVTIQGTQAIPAKGLHCNNIEFQFNSVREDLPKDILSVDSRVTKLPSTRISPSSYLCHERQWHHFWR